MAFGQKMFCLLYSWGVAPGYGEARPSAKLAPYRKHHRAEKKMVNPPGDHHQSVWSIGLFLSLSFNAFGVELSQLYKLFAESMT